MDSPRSRVEVLDGGHKAQFGVRGAAAQDRHNETTCDELSGMGATAHASPVDSTPMLARSASTPRARSPLAHAKRNNSSTPMDSPSSSKSRRIIPNSATDFRNGKATCITCVFSLFAATEKNDTDITHNTGRYHSRDSRKGHLGSFTKTTLLTASAAACRSSGPVLPRTDKPDRWHPRSRCLLHGGSR